MRIIGLPDYFMELGAVEAVNIRIDSRDLADQAIMLDSLNQYDGLFFKGGDQGRYYEYYKKHCCSNCNRRNLQ